MLTSLMLATALSVVQPEINIQPSIHIPITMLAVRQGNDKSIPIVPALVPIVYVSEFSEESAKKFSDEFGAAINAGVGIVLINVDSYGGSVYALMGMLNVVEAAQKAGVVVATSVSGKAMSCGSVLFASGTNGYRFVGPYSTILIHSVSSMARGKIPDLMNDVEEANRLNVVLFTVLARKAGKPDTYFLDILKSKGGIDWFISPQEAVSMGLANKIKVPELKTRINIENTIE